MTLAGLRSDVPSWTWTAERSGMGWRYRGVKGTETVFVYVSAVLTGPSGDDFSTWWRVSNGLVSTDYVTWRAAQVQPPTDTPSKTAPF